MGLLETIPFRGRQHVLRKGLLFQEPKQRSFPWYLCNVDRTESLELVCLFKNTKIFKRGSTSMNESVNQDHKRGAQTRNEGSHRRENTHETILEFGLNSLYKQR
jgi:hypothetical protein